jgi:hypothetical protein
MLPKLVREKVKDYLNYQRWCDKRNKMNQEYHLKVEIYEYQNQGQSIEVLSYIYESDWGSKICPIKYDKQYNRYSSEIYQWVKRHYHDNIIVPQKYCYTSGMRSMRGYK